MKNNQESLITDKDLVVRKFKNIFEKMVNIPTYIETEKDNNIIVEHLDELSLKEVTIAVKQKKREE